MTEDKRIAVYGIYPSRERVETAVELLKERGFRNQDVSVLFSSGTTAKEFAHEHSTKSPEGAAVGAGTGFLLGGTLGWLAGIGSVAIPVLGPFIAAGPIMGLLAGAGIGGAVGGLTGALVGMGMPEYEAKRYEGLVKKGGVLLSVHCDNNDWMRRAKTLLEETGATDISSASEAHADLAVDPHGNPITKHAV